MKLSAHEEIELKILTEYKLSKTRFMPQYEHDRYHYLMKKKFGNLAILFEFMQIIVNKL